MNTKVKSKLSWPKTELMKRLISM